MRVERYPENPLITPADVPPSRPDFEVLCAFNAGVARYKDEIILLLRVAERAISDDLIARVPVLKCEHGGEACLEICEFERSDPMIEFNDPRVIITPEGGFLTTMSHLRIARSRDGRNFVVDPKPAIFPDRPSEMYGVEDPRITDIEGKYYITYKGVAPTGVSAALAVTTDFVSFEKKGIIFCPENLDVCIFPEKVNGRYVALHRPNPRTFGRPNMWIAYSPDLLSWGDHRFVMGVQADSWDSGRIGGGAIPIKTEHGWLEIYHGATAGDFYCLGAVLLDLHEPHKLIARGTDAILVPEAPYETCGFVPNVVFACGAVADDDRLTLYYGAADMVIAAADMSISEILDSLECGGPPPHSID
ncbi:MAG TPA: glycoside hydrolase family 130 protein [Armatimonadota bacterium]|nr:glycoside hydrolase family 130 protein [Armatimonadota bacterium]